MGGAPRHCSLRPRTHHGPWSPPIHHGCPRPRIFYGHLENSLPLSLRLYVLSLSLVSRFPLGPSLCRGSLLRPGGRLSRLLRPGGRLSRLLRPGGCLSRLRRPGGRLSRLRRPGGRPTCQSHLTPPPTCQSPHASADLPESPHADLPESPHVSAVLSALPWWAPVSLAPHGPGPPFHLRSTALLDYALCEVSGSRPLGGGGALSRIWLPLTTLQLHITHGLHLPSFTALTHSHPPLHQSHSCHQSLINPDCFTTPASHSHTHI